MSCVYLLCSDHPLPLYESHARRRWTCRGIQYDTDGFAVREHAETKLISAYRGRIRRDTLLLFLRI